MTDRKPYDIDWGRHHLALGTRTRIMGIVNVTPDSFSDGGLFHRFDDAVAQGLRLVEAGADILDIGGESTRPFADPVAAGEEIRRVVPVIEALAAKTRVPISIDTNKAEVARRALEAGAAMINDIGALRMDPEMAGLAAAYDVPVVVMHMLGTPGTMQLSPVYDRLLEEIEQFLEAAIVRAEKGGVKRSRVIVDPGIGFGKTFTHNLTLLKCMDHFRRLDAPILVGPSRKAFIRHLLKGADGKEVPALDPRVETGTQAAVAAAIFGGAHIVRVHDVENTRATVRIIDAVLSAPANSQ
jgi:dihydropteroate synthase